MTHENDQPSPEEEEVKIEKARQDRREATESAVAGGGVEYLEARALATQIAAWSVRPEVLAVGLFNADFAKRVTAIRERAGVAVLVAGATSLPSAPRRGFEQLDPAVFARKVQTRRRMAALKQRRASR